MTESNVIYVAPNRTDAGAVPKGTNIATHDRASDGAEVQDVYIDNIPADGYVSNGNSTEVNLAGGATFEGLYDNALEYGAIRVAIYSSHVSAASMRRTLRDAQERGGNENIPASNLADGV